MPASPTYIPLLSSVAGSTLTVKQWNEAGVEYASYMLDELLFKPGLSVLAHVDIKRYMGWNKSLILNGAHLKANKEYQVKLKSPYDGGILHTNSAELMQTLLHLKPDMVLLPRKMVKSGAELEAFLEQGVSPFIAIEESQHMEPPSGCGVYCTYQEWSQAARQDQMPLYITGSINRSTLEQLKNDELYIETDQPAIDALQGIVYVKQEHVDLTKSATQKQFSVIDEDCACPTCKQKFTQAYLHHLLMQTPLLCHRFLIQHNVYQAQKYMMYSR